jgi:hypothetical protein
MRSWISLCSNERIGAGQLGRDNERFPMSDEEKKRDRALQRRVRERQAKTGESYQAAWRQLTGTEAFRARTRDDDPIDVDGPLLGAHGRTRWLVRRHVRVMEGKDSARGPGGRLLARSDELLKLLRQAFAENPR